MQTFAPIASSKGNIAGWVIDSTLAEPLPGATVELFMGDKLVQGAVADINGGYTLPNLEQGTYTVRISFPTYNTKLIRDVVVQNGKVSNLMTPLTETSFEVGPIVIETTLKESSEASAVVLMRNGILIADIYSGQQVLQTSSGLALDLALARLPGVLLAEETGLVVRGLSQRNNVVMLNQVPLLVNNLERQAFDFSILPAGMISRVMLIKSMEPRLYSNFSGGIVQFETPDFPDKNQMSFNYQTGFNTMASLQQTPRYRPMGGDRSPGLFRQVKVLPSGFPSSGTIQSTPYGSEAQAAYGRGVQLNYMPTDALAGFNHNISLRYDGVKRLENGRKLGMVLSAGGLSQHRANHDEANIVRAYDEELGVNPVSDRFRDTTNIHQTGVSAMANFALELRRGRLSFKNLVSRSQINDARHSYGSYIIDQETGEFGDYIFNPSRIYRQTLVSNQLSGEHLLGQGRTESQKYGAKLEWNLFNMYYRFTDPVYQAMNYLRDPADGQYYLDITLADEYKLFATTFDGKQTSQQYGGQVALTFPMRLGKKSTADFSVGTFAQTNSRQLRVRKYGLFPDTLGFDVPMEDLHISNSANFYAPQNLRPGGFLLEDLTLDGDNFDASFTNLAPFVNFNAKLGPKWGFQIGARFEVFKQSITNLNVDGSQTTLVDDTKTDLLPMFTLRRTFTERLQLKVVYSQSLIRPDARELSQFEFFNLSTSYRWQGNPELQRTKVNNTDIRLEYYPGGSDLISFSLFSKYFKNPIEQYIDRSSLDVIYLYSLTNRQQAIMGGAELEVRKNLGFLGAGWRFLNLFANASVVRSRVESNLSTLFMEGRKLQGQSPYLLNAGLILKHPDTDWTMAAFYNRSGNYIAVVGTQPSVFPDFIGIGRNRLDLQLGRYFANRKLEIKLLAVDVLNERFQLAQIYNNRKQFDASAGDVLLKDSKRGRDFILSFNYTF